MTEGVVNEELRCMCGSGQLGHGIPREAFERGVALKPHFIGADMGSTDIGPYYLGAGLPDGHEAVIRRDLEMFLLAGRRLNVPLLLGSAGSAGGEPHLQLTLRILYDIARQHRLSFKLAIIHAEVGAEYVLRKLRAGKVTPCGPVPELTEATVRRATRMVGQMGMEPFIAALAAGADVIIAGRACDAAVFAAYPVFRGADKGLAMHLGKIIECSSLSAEPGGRDAIMGYLRNDHFVLESMNPMRRCTATSVAAHSLYEQPNPYEVVEPGGRLDMNKAVYKTLDDRRASVSGSVWEPNPTYTIKIEGVEKIGYRYFSLGAMRCPIAVRQTPEILGAVEAMVADLLRGDFDPADYRLKFRPYGWNGAMGEGEPAPGHSNEVMVVTDVVARTPEIAQAVCSVARYNLLHYFYPGILATGGNLAVPFVPSDVSGGEVYEFSVYHLVEVDDPLELFPMELVEIREGARHG
ncbi:MAG: acyclic terpene utilization AtuA family protein [Alphaproteobacteria bacterium]|nr:acyclic terpene utilization AtuA family protein [Alphaproteobacteria bacterium]